MVVDNSAYFRGDWQLSGSREQDDGYNYIYELRAMNKTRRVEAGHFVARFFLRREGPVKFGSHYESSDNYRQNPSLSTLTTYFADVEYFDVDLGIRSIAPGETIGFKGQLTSPDGSMKSANDWSSHDIPSSQGEVRRVLWLKDGQVIAGSAP
jgi:hypothetical protein